MARIKQIWKRFKWGLSDWWQDLTDFRSPEQRAEDRAYWMRQWDALFQRETDRVFGPGHEPLPIVPEEWADAATEIDHG